MLHECGLIHWLLARSNLPVSEVKPSMKNECPKGHETEKRSWQELSCAANTYCMNLSLLSEKLPCDVTDGRCSSGLRERHGYSSYKRDLHTSLTELLAFKRCLGQRMHPVWKRKRGTSRLSMNLWFECCFL